MDEICSNNVCTGCSACYNICPVKCINMKTDIYGELHPYIDAEKCINCNSCKKVCPYSDEKYKKLYNPVSSKCYAVARKDLTQNPRCASGGVSSYLMSLALSKRWSVFATSYDKIHHVSVNEFTNNDDVNKFQGSRYAQSDIGDAFSVIKQKLKYQNVLFIGTPCQIAGLKSYLQKPYDNLYTCDLVCHGVCPQLYLKHEVEKLGYNWDEIDNVTFRGTEWKEDHWISIWKNNAKIFSRAGLKNEYTTGFYKGFTLRASCHDCKYTSKQRIGDLTFGDFLGLKKETQELKKNFCTLVIVNTSKGERLLSFLTDSDNVIIQQRSIDEAFEGGISFQKPFEWNKDSIGFRKVYSKKGYITAMRRYACPKIVLYKLLTIVRVLNRMTSSEN